MGELSPYSRFRSLSVPAASKLPGLGLLTAARMKIEAACAEATTEAELRKLAARHRLIQAQEAVITAELSARLEAAKLGQYLEIETIEYGFWQQVRMAGSEARLSLVRDSSAFEEVLAERQHIRQHRLHGTRFERSLPVQQQQHVQEAHEPALIPHVTDSQVERLATKALAAFGHLSEAEADTAWNRWTDEVRSRFADLTAQTIIGRGLELRRISQEE